ncbi:hypothetical protein Acr_25g0002090 [Actinidia rufa]|uniref:Uncharacterized protein n=1 Tax=Actinidia rufa TaxID=165716 RepID=A0A7J0GY91_9ERIC|nr:hypothetical protein Acr_25g0002090 [Actinidia rufa]
MTALLDNGALELKEHWMCRHWNLLTSSEVRLRPYSLVGGLPTTVQSSKVSIWTETGSSDFIWSCQIPIWTVTGSSELLQSSRTYWSPDLLSPELPHSHRSFFFSSTDLILGVLGSFGLVFPELAWFVWYYQLLLDGFVVIEKKSSDVSAASGAISSSSGSVSAAGSAWGPEFMSITAIRLNGILLMLLGKIKDAQIRLRMWNSMEPQIMTSAKQVWDQAKEMLSGAGLLWQVSGRFPLMLLSCSDNARRESMWVVRFLFGLLSFDGARSQILGSKEHPSLTHMTDTSSILSDISTAGCPSHFTLADGSTFHSQNPSSSPNPSPRSIGNPSQHSRLGFSTTLCSLRQAQQPWPTSPAAIDSLLIGPKAMVDLSYSHQQPSQLFPGLLLAWVLALLVVGLFAPTVDGGDTGCRPPITRVYSRRSKQAYPVSLWLDSGLPTGPDA